jgi:hypothetical protein
VVRLGHYKGAAPLQRRARAADAGGPQKGMSMIKCEKA